MQSTNLVFAWFGAFAGLIVLLRSGLLAYVYVVKPEIVALSFLATLVFVALCRHAASAAVLRLLCLALGFSCATLTVLIVS